MSLSIILSLMDFTIFAKAIPNVFSINSPTLLRRLLPRWSMSSNSIPLSDCVSFISILIVSIRSSLTRPSSVSSMPWFKLWFILNLPTLPISYLLTLKYAFSKNFSAISVVAGDVPLTNVYIFSIASSYDCVESFFSVLTIIFSNLRFSDLTSNNLSMPKVSRCVNTALLIFVPASYSTSPVFLSTISLYITLPIRSLSSFEASFLVNITFSFEKNSENIASVVSYLNAFSKIVARKFLLLSIFADSTLFISMLNSSHDPLFGSICAVNNFLPAFVVFSVKKTPGERWIWLMMTLSIPFMRNVFLSPISGMLQRYTSCSITSFMVSRGSSVSSSMFLNINFNVTFKGAAKVIPLYLDSSNE